jgi:uncharacterized repeat protein (TIGR03803 family)
MSAVQNKSYFFLSIRAKLGRASTTILAVSLLPMLLNNSGFGQTVNDVHAFTAADSSQSPQGVPTQGRDGNLYGMSSGSSGSPYGTIFSVTTTGTLSELFAFHFTDGNSPNSSVALASDGNFYGTTFGGGNNQKGVFFKISPKGVYIVLHLFGGAADGANPSGAPIQASNGVFYGTTLGDGSGSTVYRYSAATGFSTLYQFDGTQGQGILAPLIQGTNGKLYGTTDSGGKNGCGTVFQMSIAGKLLKSHSFLCGLSGSHPDGPLFQAADGSFYGTTSAGGGGGGTIFKMGSDLRPSVLYFFGAAGPHDGREPLGGLVQATDGNLYGTTLKGGSAGFGTLFQISPAGAYQLLFSFTAPIGESPFAGLLQHTNGLLYGTTPSGGANGFGALYSLDMGLGPFITFVQSTGKIGRAAQILGQGLTGTTGVTFNGIAATSFKVLSDTYLTAVVPNGATTGPVVVTTPGGTLTSNKDFVVK